MGTLCDALRAWVALLTTLSLVVAPSAPLVGAQSTPAKPPASSQAPKPAAKSPAKPAQTAERLVDGGWPRAYITPSGGNVLVYQPQVASWDKQKHMVAFSAVSYQPKGSQKPTPGSLKVEAETTVALDDRLVSFAPFQITEANFATLSKEQTREIVNEVDKSIPNEERVIALDRVLANLDKSQIIPKNVEGVKADPPPIFFSKTPAVLVNFDGDPIWSPIKDNDLKFVVNTNWDVFQHGTTVTYYLRNEQTWLAASDVKGPWNPAEKLPESFKKLPADDNWKDVKANVPGKKISASKMPKVFVSFQPAELILLQGEPKYQAVTGTSLLWVGNTESDVFRAGQSGLVYYNVAGRWFSAPDFTGPWTFATPSLPEDFKKIPLEHPRSRVLASVPGSDQAIEAVLLAQVPRTARVNKKEVKAPDVVYQGEPQFKAIEGTKVERAVNTDKDIIKVGDLYYMCFQGVWFMAKSPQGPWEVTTSVPKQIYEIPASSPSHHCTYVTVVEDDDDEWATFAYVAGYTGLMIAWGCAVWGTGWYYPPYTWYGGGYPGYYPYAHSYGFSGWYNPWTGSYGRSASVYGPYGGAGVASAYNPRTGTYARGAAAYGPYGTRAAGQAYNPRTGTYAQTRQGSNVYGSWGSSSVQRGDNWAQTARVTNRATGTTTRATRTDQGGMVSRRGAGGSGFVAGSQGGDMYAGRDGNVYRRQDGSWQQYGSDGWSGVDVPESAGQRATQARERTGQAGASGKTVDSGTYGQLQRDSAARSQGAQRTSNYSSYRSSGGGRSAGSSRGGGGGRRR